MPLYLMLTTLTEKGVQTLNSNPARLREVNRDVEELGARVLHQWASLGEYDFVNIVEAPDDLTMVSSRCARRAGERPSSSRCRSCRSRTCSRHSRAGKPLDARPSVSGLVGRPGRGPPVL